MTEGFGFGFGIFEMDVFQQIFTYVHNNAVVSYLTLISRSTFSALSSNISFARKRAHFRAVVASLWPTWHGGQVGTLKSLPQHYPSS